MKLSELRNGERAYVSQLRGSHALRLRLEHLGVVAGQELTRLYASPLGTPIIFAMRGQRLALRRSEAALVEVQTTLCEDYASEAPFRPNDAARSAPDFSAEGIRYLAQSGEAFAAAMPPLAASCGSGNCGTCASCSPRPRLAPKPKGALTLALVGNPNCGKSTVFNAITGGHERTGNYAGVTVSSAEGETKVGARILRIVDLPGTYALEAYSPEEAYVAAELSKGEVDVIVNVIDVNNLERSLLLTLQLRQLGLPMLGLLNLWDEFSESGSELDLARLTEHTGLHFIPCVASRGEGIAEMLAAAIELHDEALALSAAAAAAESASAEDLASTSASVAAAAESASAEDLASASASAAVAAEVDPAHHAHESSNPHALIHHYLSGIYTLREGRSQRLSRLADRWLAHHPVAYLIFFLLMWLIFQATFTLGAYPMDWIDGFMSWSGEQLTSQLPEGWLRDMVKDGIFGGVGGVIVFLPNILILYFFIALLEDSGYMARAAFLFDPLLRRVGLHGKSFFPMITGFGCNVPAVMATRTIESFKSRVITMVTLPFMSCSARLPIYVIFSGAFFPQYAALVMALLYLGGIVAAFGSAWLMNACFRRSDESHFVMEMPPYRRPLARSLFRLTWEKGRQYLQKMGGLILATSLAIWCLGYFPHAEGDLTPSEQQEQSYLGQIGHAITPLVAPLGFDWRMGVGVLTGMGAKELMVSTLGVLYDLDEETASAAGNDEDIAADTALQTALRAATTPAAGLAYVVFALLYFPCVATIIAIKGETGRWRFALFSALYSTSLAYLCAFVAYELMQAF